MTTRWRGIGRYALGGGVLAAVALLVGCAYQSGGVGSDTDASDKARLTRSGFLSDYGRLKPVSWGDGIECWRDSTFDAKRYGEMLVSRIVVSLAPPKHEGGDNTIDPSDLKALTDYFHASLVKALKPQVRLVDKPGPGVAVMRIALTGLVPTKVTDSVTGTLIPYGFIAEAGSGVASGRPAGSTPYMGETSMEMQFRDGASGAVLGECRDTEIGRKYAADMNAGAMGAAETWADGYVDSFKAWSYARNAFDKWSLLIAQRVAELRGVKSSPQQTESGEAKKN